MPKRTTIARTGVRKKWTQSLVKGTAMAHKACDYLFLEIATGRSLYEICTTEKDKVPNRSVLYEWLLNGQEALANAEEGEDVSNNPFVVFYKRFTAAKELSTEAILDETISIADDGVNDYVEKVGKNGDTYVAFDKEHVQRSKLRVETRQRLAEMIRPHRYGRNSSVVVNDQRTQVVNYGTVVQRAAENTRGLPSQTLLIGTED